MDMWALTMCICVCKLIGLVDTVFANGPGDLGSIPGRVIPKILKADLDTSLLDTQQYKVHIKGKAEQSRERSSGVVAIEKGAFWSPSTTVANFTYCYMSVLMFACVYVSACVKCVYLWAKCVKGFVFMYVRVCVRVCVCLC